MQSLNWHTGEDSGTTQANQDYFWRTGMQGDVDDGDL